MFGAAAWSPGSVEACRADSWTFRLTDKRTGEWMIVPFRCRSWRCPRCRRMVAGRDVERIRDGLRSRRLVDLVFVTLTFDQGRIRDAVRVRGGPELDAHQVELGARARAWRAVGRCFKRLRDRLVHRYRERFTVENPRRRAGLRVRKPWIGARRKGRIDYVAAWEGHRSGWPHVHVVLSSPELARELRTRGRYRDRSGELRWRFARQVLAPLAVASGFGPIVDADLPRTDGDALAGYLGKLARELGRADVKDQDPTPAPRGFRRIRSTPGFLAPFNVPAGTHAAELVPAPIEHVDRAVRELGAWSVDELKRTARALAEEAGRVLTCYLPRGSRASPVACSPP